MATTLGRELVRVTTPPITVHAGHAVRIAGWIKIPKEIPGSQDGVMVYDNHFGRNLALRFREACEWRRFELVREVIESRDLTLTVALTGFGEVSLDDLEISIHSLSPLQQASIRGASSEPREAAAERRWSDLRRLNPLPVRRVFPRSKP
jgi:hypothetical protein